MVGEDVLVPETNPATWAKQLAEWRELQYAWHTLERTGMKVKYRRNFSIFGLVKKGQLPDVLTGILSQALGGKDVKFSLDPSGLGDLLAMADAMMLEAVVWPPLTAQPGDSTAVSLSEIHDEDKVDFFHVLNGDANALKPFRGKMGAESSPSALTGEDVQPTAKPDYWAGESASGVSVGHGDDDGGVALGGGEAEGSIGGAEIRPSNTRAVFE